ncbi:MAG TPA: TfoX/Sxy family protein [Rhizomicrobium sp.]|jgi:DNA transformation protein
MTPEYRAFVEDLFVELGPVAVRRVFNFDGMYLGDAMFGLVVDERIFLKTSEVSRRSFVTEGCVPLHYRSRDGAEIAMSYYAIPDRLYDDPAEAAKWARAAYEVALRSPTAMRKQRKRAKPARQSTGRRRRT